MSRTIIGTGAAAALAATLLGSIGAAHAAPYSPVTLTIHNHHTGKCLDSDGSGRVYMLDCNGGDYQRWIVFRRPVPGEGNAGLDPVQLKNRATGRCLDARPEPDGRSGFMMFTAPCTRDDSQRWNDTASGGNLRQVGTRTRLPNRKYGGCMSASAFRRSSIVRVDENCDQGVLRYAKTWYAQRA